jgi:dipeptidyl aminopeptidase/acylaminoacyl peptidase
MRIHTYGDPHPVYANGDNLAANVPISPSEMKSVNSPERTAPPSRTFSNVPTSGHHRSAWPGSIAGVVVCFGTYGWIYSSPTNPLRFGKRRNDRNPNPTWSPDGSQLAFVSESDGDLDIWAMKPVPEGPDNVRRNLTDDSGSGAFDSDPSWSPYLPDGSTRVAFHRNGDVWTVNPAVPRSRRCRSPPIRPDPTRSRTGRPKAQELSSRAIATRRPSPTPGAIKRSTP